MKDASIIARRILRHGIKSNQGLQNLVGEMLGEDWQAMLSSNRRNRDGVVDQVADQLDQLINNSSFVETAPAE